MKLEDEPTVLYIGNPLLFKKQKDISLEEIHSDDFQYNLQVLKNAQIREQGIGIAAPQIGWSSKVFSMGLIDNSNDNAPNIPFKFWINPKIKAVSPTTNWTWEGCLSVPGIRGWIERPSHIDVEGYNEQGNKVQVRLQDYSARVFQHEYDHLNGLLFTMRAHDVSHLLPLKSMAFQNEWVDDWPTPNARKTPPGTLSPSR